MRALSLTLLSGLWLFPLGSGAEEKAEAGEPGVKITRADCRWLVRHRPDGSADYQPGVDVRGRKVVSADVSPRPKVVDDKIGIDLQIPLARLRPELAGTPYAGAGVVLGWLEVDRKSGSVTLDGVELDDAEQRNLIAECKKLSPPPDS